METSHKYTYAIIGAIVLVLIVGGAYFYYKQTSNPSDTSAISQPNNPFGQSRSNVTNNNGVPTTHAVNSGSNVDQLSNPSADNTYAQTNSPTVTSGYGSYGKFSGNFLNYTYKPEVVVQPYSYSAQNSDGLAVDTSNDFTYEYPLSSNSGSTINSQQPAGVLPPPNDDPALNAFRFTYEGQLAYMVGGEPAFESAYYFMQSTGRRPVSVAGGNNNSGGGSGTGAAIGGAVGGIAVSALSSSLSSSKSGSSGGSSGGLQNFGGQVTYITYCTCDASVLLNIKDVRGETKSLLYMAGVSRLFSNYNVWTTGVTVLGNYTQGGGACLIYEGEDCDSQGNPDGIIYQVGTSLE